MRTMMREHLDNTLAEALHSSRRRPPRRHRRLRQGPRPDPAHGRHAHQRHHRPAPRQVLLRPRGRAEAVGTGRHCRGSVRGGGGSRPKARPGR
jgi:hypothetical protein